MEIKDLIVDDRERGIFRVHRSAKTSGELFQQEREMYLRLSIPSAQPMESPSRH